MIPFPLLQSLFFIRTGIRCIFSSRVQHFHFISFWKTLGTKLHPRPKSTIVLKRCKKSPSNYMFNTEWGRMHWYVPVFLHHLLMFYFSWIKNTNLKFSFENIFKPNEAGNNIKFKTYVGLSFHSRKENSKWTILSQ